MIEGTVTKESMLKRISEINKVDGFDPTPFVMDFNDLSTGETRKKLPVVTQMAWFRLKYPEGKILVNVNAVKNCFVATARIYPSYKDPEGFFLAEASASREYSNEFPSISPREWAQTAAIGVALRNAGFGLQYEMAGEDFASLAPDEFGVNVTSSNSNTQVTAEEYTAIEAPPPRELTPEEKIEAAMSVMCPVSRYAGKTLGEVSNIDPNAIVWVATKYKGDESVKQAAILLCEHAKEQMAS